MPLKIVQTRNKTCTKHLFLSQSKFCSVTHPDFCMHVTLIVPIQIEANLEESYSVEIFVIKKMTFSIICNLSSTE